MNFDEELLDRLALSYAEAVLQNFMDYSRPHIGRKCTGRGNDMHINKYRNSKWLTKDDVARLSDEERIVTVTSITEEQVGDDIKPVVSFKDLAKDWPSNITGLEAMAEMAASPDTEDFVDLVVEIYVDPDVRYAGKRVGGIKVRPAPLKKSLKGPGDDFDDSVPF